MRERVVFLISPGGGDPEGIEASLRQAGLEVVLRASRAESVLAVTPGDLVLEIGRRRAALVVVVATPEDPCALELVRRLRSSLRADAPPVVALVGGDDQRLFEYAYHVGAVDVIPYPAPAPLLRVKALRHALHDPERRAIGGYVIERLLGRGAMGTVYLARREGREVALKVVSMDTGRTDPEMLVRFWRESDALRALRAPGIPRFLDAGRDDDAFYYAMEFVPGESLDARIQSGPLGDAATERMLVEISAALEAIHGTGLVHRDVKPANVIITPGGAAMLVDFGLAKDVRDHAVTRTTEVLGTLPYMAPELVRGDPASPSTDAYSLGVTGLEAALGTCPTEAPTYALARQLADGRVPRASDLIPAACPRLVEVIDGLLAPEPARRLDLAGARALLEACEGPHAPARKGLRAALVGQRDPTTQRIG